MLTSSPSKKMEWSSFEPVDKMQAEEVSKACRKGAYLIKINFGNESMYRKFVRITDKDIRWA